MGHSQKAYELLLIETREGIPLNKEYFYEMDIIVSNGIKLGQHLYHIAQTNELNVSKSTIYRHLHRGYLSASKIDFPSVVKYKPRRIKKADAIPKTLKIGRTYDDFFSFIDENEISSWVEMDTVIGEIGGKVILTLLFTFCNFMVGILLDNKAAVESTMKIKNPKSAFAANHIKFADVFPLLLTDNGGEFANTSAFELDVDGNPETKLFFVTPCNLVRSQELKKIIPCSEIFSQKEIRLMTLR